MQKRSRLVHLFLPALIACASISFFMPTFAQSAPLLSSPWEYTGPMNAKRAFHTLSLLPDGTALAAGGFHQVGGDTYLQSSETYNAYTNLWTLEANMTTPRSHHTATVLLDGRVLVVGGRNGTSFLNSAEIYNPATRTWSATGSMETARSSHTATRLQDGRVLVVGGQSWQLGYIRSAEVFDPASGSWTGAGSLPLGETRINHTAVLLPGGEVLVAGGDQPVQETIYNTAFRYNPESNSWTPAGIMTSRRAQHNAVLQRDGRVMIVGGYQKSGTNAVVYLDSSEVYNPVTNSWTNLNKTIDYAKTNMLGVLDPLGNYLLIGGDNGTPASEVLYRDINNGTDPWHLLNYLQSSRKSSAAVQLPGGPILVAGGRSDNGTQNTAEINRFRSGQSYDLPSDALWGLFSSSAAMLPNGDILISGGASTSSGPCHNHAQLWNSSLEVMDDFSAPLLNRNRCGHSTILLGDGRIVIIGGLTSTPSGSVAGGGEIFSGGAWNLLSGPPFDGAKAVLLPGGEIFILDPLINSKGYLFNPTDLTFRETLGPFTGNYGSFTLTLMKNGKVLIVGSSSSDVIEVFDPVSETFAVVPALPQRISRHTATLLPTGKVMIAGGFSAPLSLKEVYLFDPDTNTWDRTGDLLTVRSNHSAALLPDGRPVLFGGNNSTGATATVEIYDPGSGTWSSAGSLNRPRKNHQTVLTLKGKLLTLGGLDNSNNPYSLAEQFAFPNISSSPQLWKPVVTGAACNNCAGAKRLAVTGSGFTGGGEASGGGTAQSPANHPLVQIMRLDNLQMEWLYPEGASGDTHFLSKPFSDFPSGPAMVWVYVNGSFQGKVALLNGNNFNLFLPLLLR